MPISNVETPVPSPRGNIVYGSDVIAEAISWLDIPYVALNPGASYRGLHDSLVNVLGNKAPQMLLCLHEEHSVAIAQGYAKVTGKPMLAIVHSNVGLFHATMAIFNAWCDRTPVIVLGATGPVDAVHRRPWIEWIHTARDQGAIIRNYIKWDDQPASAEAARESLLRAAWIAKTAPMGPVYVNLDAGMQEAVVASALPELEPGRFMAPPQAGLYPAQVAELAEALTSAKAPVLLMGRVGRGMEAWQARLALAEKLGARVITSHRLGAAFPTTHSLHVGAPVGGLHEAAKQALRDADLIVSFDWLDLAGTLKTALGTAMPQARIVQVSLDYNLHNGWSMDHQAFPPVDLHLAAEPDPVIAALNAQLAHLPVPALPAPCPARAPVQPGLGGRMSPAEMAATLRDVLGEKPTSLLHVLVSWNGADWDFEHPLDYIGEEGGGGIGAGPGIAVGAALALRDSGRLPLALLGDGDFVMGCSAIWTAVHYRIPLLIVVVNNQSFYNDEVHQLLMAERRGRAPENKWIGMRMTDPDIDMAQLGAAQGAVPFGPVLTRADLARDFASAVAAVEAGQVAVLDVRVSSPDGR